jgi:hypothetical protein
MAAKSSPPRQQKHLAVLIDADNASAAIVEGLFEEIAKYGIASVKRIYGDSKAHSPNEYCAKSWMKKASSTLLA